MTFNTGNENSQTSHHSEEDDDSFDMTISTSWLPSTALTAVAELGVLEIIKREAATTGGYMSPAEIAGHLPTTNPAAANMLDRVMRLLASYGALTCQLWTTPEERRVERKYGLGEADVAALVNQDKVGMDSWGKVITEAWDEVLQECWYHVKEAVLDGVVPFNKAYGMDFFEYLGTNHSFNNAFNKSMANHSLIAMKKLLENYNGFQGISTLVDVAGGTGTALNMIISKYPSIKGINFDLPQVIDSAPSYPGVEHVTGDMFESVPKGDAIFMKWITHDWSDEHCIKFLKNVYDALPNHGKLIICDYILPVGPEASDAARAAFHLDVILMTLFHEGKERTEAEFEYLAKACGFQGFKIACSAYDLMVIEFLKNI